MRLTRVWLVQGLLLCVPLAAQREVPMPAREAPGPDDAVIRGNTLPQTITCHDGTRVYVEGNRNEVQLYGRCGTVRVEGNGNFVWLDRDGQVAVSGDGNVVFLRVSTTRVSSQGNGNRFELRR